MLEFVFSKSAITDLINKSASSTDGNVVIKLAFDHGTEGGFVALVSAYCEGGEVGDATEGAVSSFAASKSVSQAQINGCPRPPGCD